MEAKFKKLLFITIACTIFNINIFSQDGITVALSETTVHGFAGVFHGVDFALRNIDTDIIYKSEQLNGLISRHSFIKDLPRGRYEMVYFGSKDYERPDIIRNFFGELDFTKHEGYYLGYFRGKISVGRNMPWNVKVSKRIAPRRLTRVLRRRGFLPEGQELFSQMEYLSNNFVLPSFR